MSETKGEEAIQESDYKQFISDLKTHLNQGNLRMEILVGQESRPGELSGWEGLRFLGGICQLTDDLVERRLTEKKIPTDQGKFIKAIEDLTGKPVDNNTVKAVDNMLKPWFDEIKALKPKIKDEGVDLDYSIDGIDEKKVLMALMVLINENRENVEMLPGVVEEKAQTLSENLNNIKAQLGKGVRSIGVAEHLSVKQRAKNIARNTALVIVLIASAIGTAYGFNEIISSRDKISEFFTASGDWIAEKTGGRTTIEKNRPDRQAQFTGEMTIAHDLKNGVWPERTGAEQLLGSLDPYTNDYDQWMAFAEWCPGGPAVCFTDPNWIPEQGRPAVMDLLGVDEKGYKHYQQHPEELPAHLRQLYPDKPWLADLFNMHPTLLGLDGKSDFELWKERYPQGQSNLTPGIPLSMLGKPIIKNSLGGVEQRLDRVALGQNRIREKGRGFGTTKGFS